MDLKPGSIIENKFEIIERIGAGGMGTVYKANDLTLLRTIVLKVLSQSYNAKAFLRFQNEAKVLGKLKHAAIADIYDVSVTADGIAYLALEYVDGITLEKFIEDGDVLPLPQLLQIFIELADGLWHAHQLGVIHRDIKPGNIMLVRTEDGFLAPVLLDFGIAKYDTADDAEQRLTERGAIIGSPLYMSPEQCEGTDITPASDQYSLGCVIFECLTGAPPFTGETAYDTMRSHLNRPCPEPYSISKIPITRELSEDIVRMLAKKPEARFANMEELETAFIEHREQAIEREHEDAKRAAEAAEEKLENYNIKRFLTPKWLAILGIFAISCFYLSVHSAQQKVELSVVQPKSGQMDVTKNADEQIRIEPENGIRVWILTDASRALIAKHKNLSRLNVAATETNDETLKSFASSKNSLTNLDLRETDVKTLKYISMFKNMQWLVLSETAVDDEALKQLTQLKQLELLELRDCPNITKKSLQTFERCPSLKSVMLKNTAISKADLLALQEKMPCTLFPPLVPSSKLNELKKRAAVVARKGRPEAAVAIYKRIVDTIFSARGANSPMAIEFLLAAANVELEQRRGAEAKILLEHASAVAEKADAKLDMIQVLNVRTHIAGVFDQDTQKQIELLRKQKGLIDELGLQETSTGRNNARMLANVLTLTGAFDEAEKLFLMCKTFDFEQSKLKHLPKSTHQAAILSYGSDLFGLGNLELRRKNYQRAERYFREALAIIPPPGTTRPLTAQFCEINMMLAVVLSELGRHNEAVSYADTSVSIGKENQIGVLPNLERFQEMINRKAANRAQTTQ